MKPNTVSDWIKKGNSPKIESLYRIAEFFNVSFDYLFTGKKNSSSEISDDESKILTYYNRLDEEQKDYVKGEMVKLYKDQLLHVAESGQSDLSEKRIPYAAEGGDSVGTEEDKHIQSALQKLDAKAEKANMP